MIKIAVCDDDAVFADVLTDELNRIFDELNVETEIKTFCDPETLFSLIGTEEPRFDIVFLDIDMPGITGFGIAEEIKKENPGTLIVFISARHEFVFDSFDYHPFSFVRKDIGGILLPDLKKVCDGLVADFRQNKAITVRDAYSGDIPIAIEKILYVKSNKHYLIWKILGDNRDLKERGMIGDTELKLKKYGFIRPHGRYLVNVDHIVFFNIKINRLVLDNKESIPVSRGYRMTAHRDYLNLKRVF